MSEDPGDVGAARILALGNVATRGTPLIPMDFCTKQLR